MEFVAKVGDLALGEQQGVIEANEQLTSQAMHANAMTRSAVHIGMCDKIMCGMG
jgi:hypothetical protein